jgi:thymidine kinase
MFLEQFPDENRTNGWIEVICGSMFSGKTEELIRRIRRAEFAQQSILLVKPEVDNRYSEDQVVSHQGTAIEAKVVENSLAILNLWKKEKIVAVDEAQFFDTGLASVCSELANKGTRVIIAGLDMDFKGIPFGPMPDVLAMAEYVTKVHAICVSCGNLAQFSHRIASNEERVMLGAKNDYEPLCRTCYNKIKH